MKSNNGLQIIIRITVCVTMLSSLIGAFMLHSTPSHRESGSVLILVSVAAAVLWVLEEVVFHNHTRKYVAKLSTMISKTERDSLLNFPAPAIIIDSENVIVWYNRLFGRQVYSEEEAYGIDLTELMNIDTGSECSTVCADCQRSADVSVLLWRLSAEEQAQPSRAAGAVAAYPGDDDSL